MIFFGFDSEKSNDWDYPVLLPSSRVCREFKYLKIKSAYDTVGILIEVMCNI